MVATAVATNGPATGTVLERVVIEGDLSKLTPGDRVRYYQGVCDSLGLNPLTKPFDYIQLNNKLTLYARKDCTEQLRRRDNISIAIVGREVVEGVYVVTSKATAPDGRSDEAIGAVAIDGLKGIDRANAMMKSETKSKRRVTLSICGLGVLDESEIETVPDARRASVDHDTGEIEHTGPQKSKAGFDEWKAKLPLAPTVEKLEQAQAIYRAKPDLTDEEKFHLDLIASVRHQELLLEASEHPSPVTSVLPETPVKPDPGFVVENFVNRIRNADASQVRTVLDWVNEFQTECGLGGSHKKDLPVIQTEWACHALDLADSYRQFKEVCEQIQAIGIKNESLQSRISERVTEARERLKVTA